MREYKFVFYWKDGSKTEAWGFSPEDALNNTGIGAGALITLDYWEKAPDARERH